LALDLTVIPFFNPIKSGRDFGTQVRLRAGDSTDVCLFGDEYSGMYNLYSGYTRMPVLNTPKELEDVLAAAGTFVIGDSERLERALTPAEIERYRRYRERIGHRNMLLLAGRGPDGSFAGPVPDSGLLQSP
jgi:hypothetical protein